MSYGLSQAPVGPGLQNHGISMFETHGGGVAKFDRRSVDHATLAKFLGGMDYQAVKDLSKRMCAKASEVRKEDWKFKKLEDEFKHSGISLDTTKHSGVTEKKNQMVFNMLLNVKTALNEGEAGEDKVTRFCQYLKKENTILASGYDELLKVMNERLSGVQGIEGTNECSIVESVEQAMGKLPLSQQDQPHEKPSCPSAPPTYFSVSDPGMPGGAVNPMMHPGQHNALPYPPPSYAHNYYTYNAAPGQSVLQPISKNDGGEKLADISGKIKRMAGELDTMFAYPTLLTIEQVMSFDESFKGLEKQVLVLELNFQNKKIILDSMTKIKKDFSMFETGFYPEKIEEKIKDASAKIDVLVDNPNDKDAFAKVTGILETVGKLLSAHGSKIGDSVFNELKRSYSVVNNRLTKLRESEEKEKGSKEGRAIEASIHKAFGKLAALLDTLESTSSIPDESEKTEIKSMLTKVRIELGSFSDTDKIATRRSLEAKYSAYSERFDKICPVGKSKDEKVKHMANLFKDAISLNITNLEYAEVDKSSGRYIGLNKAGKKFLQLNRVALLNKLTDNLEDGVYEGLLEALITTAILEPRIINRYHPAYSKDAPRTLVGHFLNKIIGYGPKVSAIIQALDSMGYLPDKIKSQ